MNPRLPVVRDHQAPPDPHISAKLGDTTTRRIPLYPTTPSRRGRPALIRRRHDGVAARALASTASGERRTRAADHVLLEGHINNVEQFPQTLRVDGPGRVLDAQGLLASVSLFNFALVGLRTAGRDVGGLHSCRRYYQSSTSK